MQIGLDKIFYFAYCEVDESRWRPREQRGRPDPIEFVPKQELDQAEPQIERQRREIERLQQEVERLRKKLEAALRAGKRQAALHSRNTTKDHPKRPGRTSGNLFSPERGKCLGIPTVIAEIENLFCGSLGVKVLAGASANAPAPSKP